MAVSSFNPKTQTYTSTRPPIKLPTSPDLSLTSFIFQSTSSIPHHTALLNSNSNETLTFLQLKAHVSSLAYALRHQFHVAKHDVVLIFAPNSIRFPISFLAIVSLGAIATTANPSFTFTEISKQLYSKVSQFNVPLVFLQSSSSPNLSSAIPKFSFYSDIIKNYADHFLNSNNDVQQNDVAALMYSSGTTGTSTWKEGVYVCVSCQCFMGLVRSIGLNVGTIEKRKFIGFDGQVWAGQSMMNNKYDLSSLKQIISSAAPLSRDLIETCAHILPHVQNFQAYGMTEACGNISMENPKEGPPFSGSTGTLMPLIKSKIVSVTTTDPLPPDQMGEICFRGPTITLSK
ncbi:hypothetical protein GOBAR_AA33938 [Gossypium barbadense]|uniref:AMP-dependent synthetase/ligase domain-containing protein n=1 Tax=Gossypium barbadense TaxID=3634 RepID=A0A2P5W6P2_GOSBA|nr:hypothetical protein GOBAR_AA33938 [Gossypium barbadense]